MNKKEKKAIEAFFMEFSVEAHSLASQEFSIDPFTQKYSYENTQV